MTKNIDFSIISARTLSRNLAIILLAWPPLLLLSIAEGHAWGETSQLSFLSDIETHLRLLLALPLFILAESYVAQRLRPIANQFLSRDLIPKEARAKFDEAILSALRLRDSVTIKVLLVMAVVFAGMLITRRMHMGFGVAGWYGVPSDGKLELTLAGWWLEYVSLPIFQILLLLWYFRIFIWARFLWQVSQIDLKIIPTHPDRCAGLGFLSGGSLAFSPVLLAQGVVLAGMMANRIFYANANLLEFKLEFIGLVVLMLLVVLGPLLVFSPKLIAAKGTALGEYGTLAQRYVREFDTKWLRGGVTTSESLMGSADIQSLADLGNSYEVIKSMRLVPFTLQTVLQLALITLLPVLPLLLTMIPLEELFMRLLKLAF